MKDICHCGGRVAFGVDLDACTSREELEVARKEADRLSEEHRTNYHHEWWDGEKQTGHVAVEPEFLQSIGRSEKPTI